MHDASRHGYSVRIAGRQGSESCCRVLYVAVCVGQQHVLELSLWSMAVTLGDTLFGVVHINLIELPMANPRKDPWLCT